MRPERKQAIIDHTCVLKGGGSYARLADNYAQREPEGLVVSYMVSLSNHEPNDAHECLRLAFLFPHRKPWTEGG